MNNNNINKSNFSYDNSEEQLHVGVKIIINAFENKKDCFEKELSSLREGIKIKDDRIQELENIVENISEELKKCQEYNNNLLDENKYFLDLTEKLNEDNNKLSKFKNNILSSLQLDSNFILNQEFITGNNSNDFRNQENNQFSSSNPNFFPPKNFVSFNGNENSENKNNFNPNNNSKYLNKTYIIDHKQNDNNLNNIFSPLTHNSNDTKKQGNNNFDTNTHINDMIKSLQNKMRFGNNSNKNFLNLNNEKFNTNNNFNNKQNINNNYEDGKELNNSYRQKELMTENNTNRTNSRSSNVSQKIFDLKNKFKAQKYEKYNENVTTLLTHGSDNQKENEFYYNQKEFSGKSTKYQQSTKFFNEAKILLKKDNFDELVYLIRSISNGKITNEEFEDKINNLIGNHTGLMRDLSNVINVYD